MKKHSTLPSTQGNQCWREIMVTSSSMPGHYTRMTYTGQRPPRAPDRSRLRIAGQPNLLPRHRRPSEHRTTAATTHQKPQPQPPSIPRTTPPRRTTPLKRRRRPAQKAKVFTWERGEGRGVARSRCSTCPQEGTSARAPTPSRSTQSRPGVSPDPELLPAHAQQPDLAGRAATRGRGNDPDPVEPSNPLAVMKGLCHPTAAHTAGRDDQLPRRHPPVRSTPPSSPGAAALTSGAPCDETGQPRLTATFIGGRTARPPASSGGGGERRREEGGLERLGFGRSRLARGRRREGGGGTRD